MCYFGTYVAKAVKPFSFMQGSLSRCEYQKRNTVFPSQLRLLGAKKQWERYKDSH